MIDLDQPWEIMNQLKKWFHALTNWTLQKMAPNMEPALYMKMKEKLVTQWKTYEPAEFDEHGNLKNPIRRKEMKAPKQKSEDDDSASEVDQDQLELDTKLEMPLPDTCLKVNLGFPIVVLVNKSDLLLHGDKKNLLDENFDFI